MGGDRGPATVVAGMAESAEKNPDIRFIVHGPRAELEALIARRSGLAERCDIRDATGVVTMDDKPSQVLRKGGDTSMWSALESVRSGEALAAWLEEVRVGARARPLEASWQQGGDALFQGSVTLSLGAGGAL